MEVLGGGGTRDEVAELWQTDLDFRVLVPQDESAVEDPGILRAGDIMSHSNYRLPFAVVKSVRLFEVC